MADDLLRHYNDELFYIRRLAAEFAEAHPKIAGRLRLSADAVEDPHVARLIEAFSLLTARIRQKLDDEFPELTDGLLSVLYPHYLAPVPPMAIVQFGCQSDLAVSQEVPRGAEIDTEAVNGETCRFRTCYPVALWPLFIESARVSGRPLVAPVNPRAAGAVSSLCLSLRCLAPDMTFTKLGPDSLRFFLRGQPQEVFALYELLFNNTVSVALADSTNDPTPVILPASAVRPVGFEREDGLLPLPSRSLPGYRLLTEYFALAEKFMFFDITGLSAKLLIAADNKLNIFFYFNRAVAGLERNVTADNFMLGCTPVINLFAQRAEPIPLTQEAAEYRIVPDARRPGAMEVYSIDRVVATSSDGTTRTFDAFYSTRHSAREDTAYWCAARRPGRREDGGTEVFLSLVDDAFDLRAAAGWTLSTDTTCLNRDLPARLPYGGGRPKLELIEGHPGVSRILCITPPTSTLRPPPGGLDGRWRLISHLMLNRLSLVDGPEGAEALREMLRLYDFRDSSETRAVIDSLLSVKSRPGVARAPAREMGTFCSGTDVTIEFDEERFSTSGIFLLAMVLERFLGHYCAINSFSRMTATIRGRTEILRQWRPRAGDLPLL